MRPRAGTKFTVETFVIGPLEVNCYIISDPNGKEAFLVDPGAEAGRLKKFLRENSLGLKFIINTHGHGDHIAANGYFDAPVYIHRLDKDFLKDPAKNLSGAFGFLINTPEASRLLEDKEKIPFGGSALEIIHTPGHTPGSISIKLDSAIFTGDALFHGSIGRTDFDYGDERVLLDSIRKRLLVFADDTVIYPGHGPESTIGEERRSNPFLR